MQVWELDPRMVYTISGLQGTRAFIARAMDAITNIVRSGAFAGSTIVYTLALPIDVTQALVDGNRIQHCEGPDPSASGWQLAKGWIPALAYGRRIHSPRQLFTPREGLALQEKSVYELLKFMVSDGWRWKLWIPVSKRRKHGPAFPSGYKPGDEKIFWSSGHAIPAAYLVLLCKAEGHT